MSSVMMLKSLEDTTLCKRLDEGFKGADEEVANELAVNLKRICKEASDRMKAFPSLHPQYTLHDETHLLRVTELMAKIIPKETLDKLNPVEIALLILSAYYHDQGMVLEKEELEGLDSMSEFKIFSDTWAIDHPNLVEVQQQLNDKNLSPEEKERCRKIEQELLAALLTDYARENHGPQSAKFVRSHESNPLWEIAGTKFAYLVAMLCESHVKSASDLSREKGFYHDQSVGAYKVNMPYLGLVLRLADILDFDRERTPDALYRTIHFTSDVSLVEWEKHRSVEGWEISPKTVRFDMRCEHPIYERAAREFMNRINDELADAQEVAKSFPQDFKEYKLDLPLRTDISRIKPKDDAYIYHDLEFSLSRDEVVKLLMMEELYHSPSLCVRELLQNALDALRYRKALIKRDIEADWTEGKVEMEHTVDENGYEVVCCTDNGVGMDKTIITDFLTNVGRSYYRSPIFEQERVTFREAGVDFDPCSQFGIGFMSYFMIGDRIIIHTRRMYGNNRKFGDPLVVEINGLGGMVVIRKGSEDQAIGTTIKIIGRKKPRFFDEEDDLVELIDTVDGYAIATEFPIEARCSIPEIEGSISVPPTITIKQTKMERAGIKSCKIFTQEFSEIDPNLRGLIRTSFLIDKDGHLAVENDEAKWVPRPKGSSDLEHKIHLFNYEEKSTKEDLELYFNQTCLDGILVDGITWSRIKSRSLKGGSDTRSICLGKEYFVLDVRGSLKPPLTPSREPLPIGPRWNYLEFLAYQAQGRLWEQIVQYIGDDANWETFWQLVAINQANVTYMCSEKIWSQVYVPVFHDQEDIKWERIASLGILKAIKNDHSSKYKNYFRLIKPNGAQIGSYETLDRWDRSYIKVDQTIKNLVAGMSRIILEAGQPCLEVSEPTFPDKAPWEYSLRFSYPDIITMQYGNAINKMISVQLPFPNANRDHPLVKMAFDAQYLERPSEIQKFALSAVCCLSGSLDELTHPECIIGNSIRRLSQQYLALDWSLCEDELLRPPYEVWLKESGLFEITEDHFKQWSETSNRYPIAKLK